MADNDFMPKSTLTVLNDEYRELTRRSFFVGRKFNLVTRQWSYRFRTGETRVTYVGALLLMRSQVEAARSLRAYVRSDG